MVFYAWSAIVAFILVFTQSANSLPFCGTRLDGYDSEAILVGAAPAAPHFVAYTDAYDGITGPPPVAQVMVIINTPSPSYLMLKKSFVGLQCYVNFIFFRSGF